MSKAGWQKVGVLRSQPRVCRERLKDPNSYYGVFWSSVLLCIVSGGSSVPRLFYGSMKLINVNDVMMEAYLIVIEFLLHSITIT